MTAWHPCDRGQAGWNSELKNVFGRISKEGFAPFGVRVAFTVCNFLTHTCHNQVERCHCGIIIFCKVKRHNPRAPVYKSISGYATLTTEENLQGVARPQTKAFFMQQ